MNSEFGSLGDGIKSNPSSSSRPSSRNSTDKLYPSLFPSDDEEECESVSGNSGTSDARSTPPLIKCKNPLFPTKDHVDHLRPEEIRWFYKSEDDKKWSPFIGYDSLRLECRYRALETVEDQSEIDTDVILVRGGLHQVDVASRSMTPVYWTGESSPIMRGMWFNDSSGQPLEEDVGNKIENDHIDKFLGHRYDLAPTTPSKGPKPVLHSLKFPEFDIEWNSLTEIQLISQTASKRFIRKLGFQKDGVKLRRGYKYEAIMEDKPQDISHLVFVIHGIGQKMETGNIIRRCTELRSKVNSLLQKHFPNLEEESNQRAEFLPVEWRSSLTLDGDMVTSITPDKMKGIRSILNSTAMDILYYTSPLYRSEITHSLQTELNRLYQMFCTRNPYFEASGGKVSIVAHSLGAVITYDIMTAWNPIQLYDQYVTSVIKEEEEAADSTEIKNEISEVKKRVNDAESLLKSVHEKHQHKTGSTLQFTLENFFCLGSPLAVFLALRGIRPQGKGTIDHILPSNICKRLFNIYHPYDPVAYRLEPLVLKHYSTIIPLPIHRFDNMKKVPYQKMKTKAYAAFKGTNEKLSQKGDDVDSADGSDSGNSRSRESSPSRNQSYFSILKNWSGSKEPEDMSAELQMLEKLENDVKEMEKSIQERKEILQEIDQTDLEFRIDYQLQESRYTSSYISMVTSHTSYWADRDVAFFVLTHLYPNLMES
ncbi:hypothetical protein FSP39_010311 [Pinctada imbricata]|uniref:DDHD domain-containing protein n=1 Tax=Pinctada imbricata TaxID=66713 RepID=A0AA88XVU2_PINIB|nr:hypothetical protein FSP39_010311 [Pinctada imbricata]